MKNFTKLFGLIAIVAVIGFSFAACDDGTGDDDGGGNGGGGKLTITDIPTQGQGIYVAGQAMIMPKILEFAASKPANNNTYQGVKISGNSVVLNMYVFDTDNMSAGSPAYSGSDLVPANTLKIFTHTVATIPAGEGSSTYTKSVQFTNGSATISFNDFEDE